MDQIPVTCAIAEYRGQRFEISFSTNEWVALQVGPDIDIPDAFARGESCSEPGCYEPWAKVPRSTIESVSRVSVSGLLGGHTVSLIGRLRDGRIRVSFIGAPVVAKELGLHGDQYMGWLGLVEPGELTDIQVNETRWA
ncbi:hypothetical protein OS122_24225 [Mycolicibacterium mucogenicum]|uniref:hypothetical protein n=1 Tax=Mycolicibacterium TaxID=1866885 RepID=UPI00226AF7A4|nr:MULTISPECIES: hypothetical protein [Mycolicibacterium]MCX8564006.1 hypothetical protein [Mycolicibacterium mucogenicum]